MSSVLSRRNRPTIVLCLTLVFLLVFLLRNVFFSISVCTLLDGRLLDELSHRRDVHDSSSQRPLGTTLPKAAPVNKKSPSIVTAPIPRVLKRLNGTNQLAPSLDFSFHHGANFCSKHSGNVSVLISVHSAPWHFENRIMIRNTWGHSNWTTERGFVLFFVVGETPHPEVQSKIDKEAAAFEDMVQYDVVDSYKNMTYKSLAEMVFLQRKCSQTGYKWFLKTDDDMFIYLNAIVQVAERIMANQNRTDRTVFCEHVFDNALVYRNPADKWYVAREEYAQSHFPRHCPGSVNLFTRDLVDTITEAAARTPFLWIDDAYITGVLVQSVKNIKHIQLPRKKQPWVLALHTFQKVAQLTGLFEMAKKANISSYL